MLARDPNSDKADAIASPPSVPETGSRFTSLPLGELEAVSREPSLALPWDFPSPPPPYEPTAAGPKWATQLSVGASYLTSAPPASGTARGETSPLGRAEAGLLLRRDLGRGGWWAGLSTDASRRDERYRYTASDRTTARVYHPAAFRVGGEVEGDSVSVGVRRVRRVDHVNHTTAVDAGLLLGYDFPAARTPVRFGVFGGAHYRLHESWRGLSDASAATRATDALAVGSERPYVDYGRLRWTGGLRVDVPLLKALTTGLEVRGQWGRGATYATPDGGPARAAEWGLGARLRVGYRFGG